MALAEVATRFVVEGSSKIQRRIDAEYREALTVRRSPERATKELLIVGTSLLLTDVDMPSLATSLPTEWHSTRFTVEQTAYIDWYYGMRRLYREGTRPDVLALVLTPKQMATSEMRGDYFGHYLMDADDVVSVARDARLDPTRASSLLLARYSWFWGFRAEMRKVLLGRIMPGFAALATALTGFSPDAPDDNAVYAATLPRLEMFRQMAEAYGSTFLLIVPTVPQANDGVGGLVRAGDQAHVPILVPMRSGSLDATCYADGFHMNEKGARVFTAHLSETLKPVLDSEARLRTQSSAAGPQQVAMRR